MNNPITTIVLLGVLLLLLIAPLSALAPLTLLVVVSVIGLMGWTVVRILVFGTSEERDRSNQDAR